MPSGAQVQSFETDVIESALNELRWVVDEMEVIIDTIENSILPYYEPIKKLLKEHIGTITMIRAERACPEHGVKFDDLLSVNIKQREGRP